MGRRANLEADLGKQNSGNGLELGLIDSWRLQRALEVANNNNQTPAEKPRTPQGHQEDQTAKAWENYRGEDFRPPKGPGLLSRLFGSGGGEQIQTETGSQEEPYAKNDFGQSGFGKFHPRNEQGWEDGWGDKFDPNERY